MKIERLLTLVALPFALVACDAEPPQTAAATAPANADTVWVDVRTAQEHAQGHVAGALLIPYDQMEARLGELDAYRDQPVVLYCRSGRRSGIALDVLRRHGFEHAVNGGAYRSLARSGIPTAVGPAQ